MIYPIIIVLECIFRLLWNVFVIVVELYFEFVKSLIILKLLDTSLHYNGKAK